MINKYELLYSEINDILSLYKTTDTKIVEEYEGRYGIINYRDVRNNVIKLDIPNPSFVLSLTIDDLKRL